MNALIICVWFVVVAIELLLFWRLRRVSRYRMKLLTAIRSNGLIEAKKGGNPMWRFAAFERVSFYAMLFNFWRRLDSFYPDKRFVMPPDEILQEKRGPTRL